jgi:ubiquinone/menaquinone biosynthesis methyltransferase
VKWHRRFSSPERKRQYVRGLFATIADRYDFITVFLSYGQDKRWKRRLADLAADSRDLRVLDVACGTGDIAFELAARGARVVGLDFTHRMLELAQRKPHRFADRVSFVTADMMALPFPDDAFDLVTTGYGLRNVPELSTALTEIRRVLRAGGRVLSLDFNKPSSGVVRAVYLAYLTVVGSALGAVLHGDPDTYRYIPESIRRHPGAAGLCALAEQAGFRQCQYEPLLGGLMVIHSAQK